LVVVVVVIERARRPIPVATPPSDACLRAPCAPCMIPGPPAPSGGAAPCGPHP